MNTEIPQILFAMRGTRGEPRYNDLITLCWHITMLFLSFYVI